MKALFVLMLLAFMAMSFSPAPPVTSTAPSVELSFMPSTGSVDMMAVTPAPAVVNKYPYLYRRTVTLTSGVAVVVSPENYTLTYATLPLDTSATITATTTKSVVGDRIILQITADATTRHVDFSTGFTAVDDSILANKIKVFEFVYSGSRFVQVSEIQDN